MKPCRNGAECNFPRCKFSHPWQQQPQMQGWPHYCPMYQQNFDPMRQQPYQQVPYLPNFCPAFMHPPQPYYSNPYQVSKQQFVEYHEEVARVEVAREEVQPPLLMQQKKSSREEHHHGRRRERSRGHHHSPSHDHKHHMHKKHHNKRHHHSSSESSMDELAEDFKEVKVTDFPYEKEMKMMGEMGFTDTPLNAILLNHFEGNADRVVDMLMSLQEPDEEDYKFRGEPEYRNFLILKKLGFTTTFRPRTIFIALSKRNNNLQETLLHLTKKRKIVEKKELHKRKQEQREFEYLEQYEQSIPEGCELLIDGFNIIPTNKHLRKLFLTKNNRYMTEAIMRLKILVETLREGHLVLDRQFSSDVEEHEIYASIDVDIQKPKLIRDMYTRPTCSADDKIVELLTAKTPERQRNTLLVTADHELIQRCLQVSKGGCLIMNGKRFIKLAKKLHDCGIRKKILINKDFD